MAQTLWRFVGPTRAAAIAAAATRIATGELDAQCPFSVWQTGSGTQSHMNVNEVIATLATRKLDPADDDPGAGHRVQGAWLRKGHR